MIPSLLELMPNQTRPRPVVLCVLDGWGHRQECEDNSICQAKTPNWHRFLEHSPHALLQASELFVGLPSGQMGNSEVGHMNLGAGRVVLQDLPRIDEAVASGALAKNPRLLDFIAKLKESGGRAHLMGLLSPGGVHSHQDHLVALAKAVAGTGVPVAIHAFLDGRDTPPKSAAEYLEKFLGDLAGTPGVSVATVSGRYYAMDRDKRWDRVEKAYRALVDAAGESAPDPLAAIRQAYDAGQNDEFVLPTVIAGYRGMTDGDGILCGNFRADRVREILGALLDPDFAGFVRPRIVRFTTALGLTEYSADLRRFLGALFPPEQLTETLGEVVARQGLKQLRIAETEKYAHVTFFFNGGREIEFPGESRILVPSPKVATYDLQPEMSAYEVTEKLVAAIDRGEFDLVVLNFANADMVGHSGKLDAAIRAVETVDDCLGRIAEAVQRAGGVMLITADHGNAEQMKDTATGQPHTAHTTNPVPVILVNAPPAVTRLADGRLADVAPTLLDLLDIAQPKAMTGKSLVVREKERQRAAE
jgi:2,3-bisphosphoglycerate-independent phosphoglycerate mutase